MSSQVQQLRHAITSLWREVLGRLKDKQSHHHSRNWGRWPDAGATMMMMMNAQYLVVAILKHGGTEKNDLQYMPYYCRLLMTCSVGL